MPSSAVFPVALQNKLRSTSRSTSIIFSSASLNLVRNLVFFLFILRLVRRSFYTVRGHGLIGTVYNACSYMRLIFYSLYLRTPGVRRKVDKQVSTALTKLEAKLVPQTPGILKNPSLPKQGWSHGHIRAELDKLASMEHTKWEEGRVSGAVYHGGEDLIGLQTTAFHRFAVSNPIHPDVFPGVRKMEAEVVAMVLGLFNAPEGAAGVMTGGGTESILMACLSARQKAYVERRVTEPEMIIPYTAHAAFNKASHYFGIKLHMVPCPAPDYKVDIRAVRRLINPNTIILVGSAPNFPHGIVDDIPALSRLALKHKIPLHVDCCLGSFVIAFLKRAGYPSPYEEQGGFDFRLPGVTSISADTHKYGFASKGSSVVLYRNRALRSYQYFILPTWSGGVYASPSMAGSRPGALIAACWVSLMALGESGYIDCCHQIMAAARTFEQAIREHPALSTALAVIGKPSVSVVAWQSATPEIDIYDIADALSAKGWHLNALQTPPAIHVAFTVPTAAAVEKLIADLVAVVEQEKAKVAERKKLGLKVEKERGDVSALYGVAGSIPDKSIVSRLAEGFLDTLYLA
ncbi:sphingosine-1-phosphate lyase [Histoplasma capsulatum var. duboisii H88]|uniref:sphinganine-1-phosphate aldolase n=2 Tax=Ajellomyces capsulatus TaxID=5037 RepID=F0U5F0_AJEC8|nr:sphingosine-1-phosphate lyase [Histoplasma capsulatum H143]EGC41298.1 sphingosine-1-phosphate lyase [Histoplasma capsulatum var. duboisii H88]QSS52287.1 sphingosine-1-phosphate lyase [Histoplasma capsulatum var. duboisii H88]